MYYRSAMGQAPGQTPAIGQPVDPYGPPPSKSSWDWFKSIGAGALSFYGKAQTAAGREQAWREELERRAQAQRTPPWLLPVGIVGGAVVLALVLRKRKSA